MRKRRALASWFIPEPWLLLFPSGRRGRLRRDTASATELLEAGDDRRAEQCPEGGVVARHACFSGGRFRGNKKPEAVSALGFDLFMIAHSRVAATAGEREQKWIRKAAGLNA